MQVIEICKCLLEKSKSWPIYKAQKIVQAFQKQSMWKKKKEKTFPHKICKYHSSFGSLQHIYSFRPTSKVHGSTFLTRLKGLALTTEASTGLVCQGTCKEDTPGLTGLFLCQTETRHNLIALKFISLTNKHTAHTLFGQRNESSYKH